MPIVFFGCHCYNKGRKHLSLLFIFLSLFSREPRNRLVNDSGVSACGESPLTIRAWCSLLVTRLFLLGFVPALHFAILYRGDHRSPVAGGQCRPYNRPETFLCTPGDAAGDSQGGVAERSGSSNDNACRGQAYLHSRICTKRPLGRLFAYFLGETRK